MLAAIRVALRDFEFSCHVDRDPDPRLPARQVKTQLWTYRSLFRLAQDARPTAPRPPGVIDAAIPAMAEYPYLLRVSSDVARRAVGTLPATALPEVLATMVHWVAGPKYVEAWNWRQLGLGRPRCHRAR